MMSNKQILIHAFIDQSNIVNTNLYEGNFEITNKAVEKQQEIVKKLREIHGGIDALKKLMSKENSRQLRLHTASFLFDDYRDIAIKVFEEISQGNDKLAFSAKWGLKARLGKSNKSVRVNLD